MGLVLKFLKVEKSSFVRLVYYFFLLLPGLLNIESHIVNIKSYGISIVSRGLTFIISGRFSMQF